jgi:hypothetical protein
MVVQKLAATESLHDEKLRELSNQDRVVSAPGASGAQTLNWL